MADLPKLLAFLEKVKVFFITTLPTFFNTFWEKVKTMATWKKALIIVAILLITHGGVGLGLYIIGTKTCEPEGKPDITPGKPIPHTTIYKPVEKNSVCGKVIDIAVTMETEKKLKVIAKDTCKITTAFFNIDFNCPTKSHNIGFGPSVLFVYDNTGRRFMPLIGGKVSYTHFWGAFGLGGAVSGYGAFDKTAYAAGIDLMLNYRF